MRDYATDRLLASRESRCGIRISTTVIRVLLVLAAAAPLAAPAQSPTAPAADSLRSSITGTVKDSLGFPVDGASILLAPEGSIYRTDSAGRFVARDVGIGTVTISVRKLGFAPLQSQVALLPGAALAVALVLQRVPQELAAVEIKAERQCPRFTIDGVLCRREQGVGLFMNRAEILEKGADFPYAPTMVLRDEPGFRRSLTGLRRTVQSTVRWRCIKYIYDGGFPYSYNPIPKVSELYAVEVFQPPDIPPEYRHWYWVDGKEISKPCTLVVLWSMAEAKRDVPALAKKTKKK